MLSSDPDFRFMALSDLHGELQRDGFLASSDEQRKLCSSLRGLLQDSSSEVQGLAMRCLPALVTKVNPSFACDIVDSLVKHLLDRSTVGVGQRSDDMSRLGAKSFRDVASLGLKSIMIELSPGKPVSQAIAGILLPQLLNGANRVDHDDVQLDCLELLHETLLRHSESLMSAHDDIQKQLLMVSLATRPMVRKRAITCISDLCVSCSRPIFDEICAFLKDALSRRAPKDMNQTRTAVLTLSAIAKTCGYRLAEHLPDLIVPLMNLFEENEMKDDEELMENFLHALDSLVSRCGHRMSPYIDRLVTLFLTASTYDPNYAFAGEVDNDGVCDEYDATMDYQDDEEEEEEEDYSDDDDDTSWKIRRAAIRCINSLILSRLRDDIYSLVGPLLVRRLSEREENVLNDVLSTLLNLVKSMSSRHISSDSVPVEQENVNTQPAHLSSRVPTIVKTLRKLLSRKSVKTNENVILMFRSLVSAVPEAFGPCLSSLIPDLKKVLTNSSSSLVAETLVFLKISIEHLHAEHTWPTITSLLSNILAAAKDRYYKIVTEALFVCFTVVRKLHESSMSSELEAVAKSHVREIYAVALESLKQKQQDSEVKEAAIRCVGAVIAYFSPALGTSVEDGVEIIMEKLNADATRLSAVRSIEMIASSSSCKLLTSEISPIVQSLGSYMRKADRRLRITSMCALIPIAKVLPSTQDQIILDQISTQISDQDMKLTSLAVSFCTDLAKTRGPSIVALIAEKVYPQAISCISSSLFQDPALSAMEKFLLVLAEFNSEPLTFPVVFTEIKSAVTERKESSRSVMQSAAQCLAALCSAAGTGRRMALEALLSDLTSPHSSDANKVFALVCLAEQGRRSLIAEARTEGHLRSAIFDCINSPVDIVKSTAAIAYGAIASSNGEDGITLLLETIQERNDLQYMLLISLREAILCSKEETICRMLPALLPLLLDHTPITSADSGAMQSSDVGEESIRSATAECLGLLAKAEPGIVIAALDEARSSENSYLRSAAATAVKFAVSGEPSSEFDCVLGPKVTAFLSLLVDADVNVRKGALLAANALGRFRPELLRAHFEDLMQALYAQTRVNRDLIRTVNLGPFKYEEDDGLEARKTTFECMATMLATFPEAIDLTKFIEALIPGLTDHVDVKAVSLSILASVAKLPTAPSIIPCLGGIFEALNSTLKAKLKENAVRQEIERHEDAVRGALRALHSLERVPEISRTPEFREILKETLEAPTLAECYENLGHELEDAQRRRNGDTMES